MARAISVALSLSGLACVVLADETDTVAALRREMRESFSRQKEEIQSMKDELESLRTDNKDLRAKVARNTDMLYGSGSSQPESPRMDASTAAPGGRRLTGSSSSTAAIRYDGSMLQLNSAANFSGTLVAPQYKTTKPVSFYACASDGQSVSTQYQQYTIDYLVEEYPAGAGYFSTSSSQFTAPYDGLYLFHGKITNSGSESGGNWARMAFKITYASDGSEEYKHPFNTKGDIEPIAGFGIYIFPLSVGDVVSVHNLDSASSKTYSWVNGGDWAGGGVCGTGFGGYLLTLY